MGRRQLPLFGTAVGSAPAPFAAPDETSLAVDPRCLAVVCSRGLDAAAEWLTALRFGFVQAGLSVPFVYAGPVQPVSAAGRALVSDAQSTASLASGLTGAALWLLAADAQVVPLGAGTLIVLVDRLPARASDTYAHAAAFLTAERVATAAALAREIAASTAFIV